jgi:hypothetical protein
VNLRGKVEMTINSGLQCRCKAAEFGGSVFLFAWNIGSADKSVIRVEGLRAGTNIEAVGEEHAIASDRGESSDGFAPPSEHVYKLKL